MTMMVMMMMHEIYNALSGPDKVPCRGIQAAVKPRVHQKV